MRLEVPLSNQKEFFENIRKKVFDSCLKYGKKIKGWKVTEKGIEPILKGA